jgi:hypothetical protein
MSFAAVKHSRRKIVKAHHRERKFNVQVRVTREPVYVRGTIFGTRVRKEPAFRAQACVTGAGPRRVGSRLRKYRCAVASAHGPTAAVKRALAKLVKLIR